MAKLQLKLDDSPEAVKLQQHPNSTNVVQVNFSDKTKALVSLAKDGYFDGNDPMFLDDDNKLTAQFEIKNINGTNWIIRKGAGNGGLSTV